VPSERLLRESGIQDGRTIGHGDEAKEQGMVEDVAIAAASSVVLTRPSMHAGVINAQVSSELGTNAFVTVSDQFVLAGGSNGTLIGSESNHSLTVSMNVAAEITTHPMSLVAGSNVTRERRRPIMQVRPLPSMLRAVAALPRARGGQRVIFLPPSPRLPPAL
jgi:hypothetical protein